MLESNVSSFVSKCHKASSTLPDSVRQGASAAGQEVKAAWLGVAAANGMPPGGKIARRSWSVKYTVQGGTAPSTLLAFNGPVHLVIGSTKQHLIGARRLGTRGALAAKTEGLGAVTAFGGTGQGMFGAMRNASRTTKSGSVLSNGAAALTIGGNLRAYAFHPGTRGKPALWEEAKKAATDIGPHVYQAETSKALIKAGFGAGFSAIGL